MAKILFSFIFKKNIKHSAEDLWGYEKIADQFDVFIKGRYSTQGIHGRWAFYPEPPFLLLTGVTYKFDFQY